MLIYATFLSTALQNLFIRNVLFQFKYSVALVQFKALHKHYVVLIIYEVQVLN